MKNLKTDHLDRVCKKLQEAKGKKLKKNRIEHKNEKKKKAIRSHIALLNNCKNKKDLGKHRHFFFYKES